MQLISLFNPSSPWVRPNDEIVPSAEPEPGELTPEELEIAHFDKFLRARFFKGYAGIILNIPWWILHSTTFSGSSID